METSFSIRRPLKLLILLEQLGHGLAYLRKSFDKSLIISSQSKKTLNITDTRRRIPTQYILNLAWIHRYTALQDDVSQESNLLHPKLTFAQLGIQPILSKLLQS
jgi:hypothetical protein